MYNNHTQRSMRNQKTWQGIEALEARELLSAAPVHHAVKTTTPAAKTAAIHVDAKAKQKTSHLRTTAAVVQKKAAKAVVTKGTKASPAVALKNNALNACRGEQIAKAAKAAANGATFGINPIQPPDGNTGNQPKTPQSALADAQAGIPGMSSAPPDTKAPGPISTTLSQILAVSGPAAQMQQFTAGIGNGPASAAGLAGLIADPTGVTLQSAAGMASDFQQSFKGGLPTSPTFGDSRIMDGDDARKEDDPAPVAPATDTKPTPAPNPDTSTPCRKQTFWGTVRLVAGTVAAAIENVIGTGDSSWDDDNGSGGGVRGTPNPDAVDPDVELPPLLAVIAPETEIPAADVNAPVNQLEPDDDTARNATVGKAPLTQDAFDHRLDPIINSGEDGQSDSDSKLILPATAAWPEVDPRDLVKAAVGGTTPPRFGR